MIKSCVLVLSTLCILAQGLHNPGVVVQIPNNMVLPVLQLNLPQSIPSIVAQKLELNDIKLRDVQYNWIFSSNSFVVRLIRTVVSFEWIYGHDSGLGTFQEQYSDLVVNWTLGVDAKSRFKIDVDSAKITNEDKRHNIKIHLGGKVPETLVVIVTNQILNHGKFAFRSAVKTVITDVILAATQPLREDLKITCVDEKCIYLDTTLVSKPNPTEKIVFLQINGAPYISGTQPKYLDPEDAIIKADSGKINVHVHQLLLNNVAKLYLQLKNFSISLNTTEISDIAEINSQTLSMIFPKMKDLGDPVAVVITLLVDKVQLDFNSGFQVNVDAHASASTWSPENPHSLKPYIESALGQICLKLQPVVRDNLIGARFQKISIESLKFKDEDINNKLVAPTKLSKHFNTLLKWAEEGINGGIGDKKELLEFAGVEVLPSISFANSVLRAEIGFHQKHSMTLTNMMGIRF